MKYIYSFGNGTADGTAKMKNVLGGKGANLAEMNHLGIPVPPGFTITTDVCTHYYKHDLVFPEELKSQTADALKNVETIMDSSFGDKENPLLISVRSGARQSMPGMMETVLNVGLTSVTIPGLIAKTGNPRFVYDAYRRLITMYADVVMEKAAGIEPAEGQGVRQKLEQILDLFKKENGLEKDTDLSGDQMQEITETYKKEIKNTLGSDFPDDPSAQLWGGVEAVFKSWNGARAISYRRIENIPDEWGTAVNVQAMVFGNMGDDSATGVAFTRNPATGENQFYGEWLANAQGEDVVAGLRTPNPLNEATKTADTQHLPSLESSMPELYSKLAEIRTNLENHYTDMQDIEFTIQEGRLWMLQTRVGKRNGSAAIKMAVDMVDEGLINKNTALLRVKPEQLDELLHPMIDPESEKNADVLAKGLPAGPGGAKGRLTFTADDAESWHQNGEEVILIREETSPEDVHGMHAAEAILTAKGGMTSHAALVARGWGKCCIVGCGDLHIKLDEKEVNIGNTVLKEGDWITMNGTVGKIYQGQLNLIPANPDTHKEYKDLMAWADEVRTLKIRTNADSPDDASQARTFGAQGIGLCRTEHMFFDEERILAVRKMILADNTKDKRSAVMELLPFQKKDFKGILAAMENLPVTIRLLDPPLHEFMTLSDDQMAELAESVGVEKSDVAKRVAELHELNPMLGHRGCRLGVAYPEITEMQARAIIEAGVELTQEGKTVYPEIMIPLVGTVTEYLNQEKIIRSVAESILSEANVKLDYTVGTMIELPRACLTADEIAEYAEFFSFGTNDLTQTTYGFSRDDIGGFLPEYLDKKILAHDPFQSLDIKGVGKLVSMAVELGRGVNSGLKIGICGEHGGDPASIHFCKENGLDYVSCSPFRVPVARLAAAQAEL
ncbi:MAG: pyruvate, phosphate dikinase [Candidatus Marinimicrobia bacterium]|jgi:pyruvate,orthophosphate dikinase|nr:pyruvate, phosphate dikinase [Candidatus Neomarinimicrobiota bacterium]MDP6338855.1 pyruvate, phosphate dikinase [Candidatus Neomarinimicrobiota bacterium]MDP6726026.1 pyruvate, phosphate dikinase [Candidatus Neomarinimicrobiota bacterium]MDP6991198.1 pyruvate, phosphate dikinase [Candidatus Neomarinimicrobiota bacterium]|tara:strand:+ start:72 stop:2765 length:2694 start_codon:yes stop_codon:yes gene_type:complete